METIRSWSPSNLNAEPKAVACNAATNGLDIMETTAFARDVQYPLRQSKIPDAAIKDSGTRPSTVPLRQGGSCGFQVIN